MGNMPWKKPMDNEKWGRWVIEMEAQLSNRGLTSAEFGQLGVYLGSNKYTWVATSIHGQRQVYMGSHKYTWAATESKGEE